MIENKLTNLFKRKNKQILNIYCTAGYPNLHDTTTIIKSLSKNGADIIEVGIPYSDPLADGPTIQQSNKKALENGITLSIIFNQLSTIKNTIDCPIILMGYLNPILQYGYEKFCMDAANAGVDGLIIPDMPFFEFENSFQHIAKKNNLSTIFLITPDTSIERIKIIDELSTGFIYVVSSTSITGNNNDLNNSKTFLLSIQNMHLKNPILVGFGIKSKENVEFVNSFANGAIIGSAYIQTLSATNNIEDATKAFIHNIIN